jgi:hypothetical protein
MTCPLEKNGFCAKVQMHVPVSWCADVCKTNWEKHRFNALALPSLPRMAVNLAGAAIKHLAEGLIERSDEKQKEFLEICKVCNQMIIKDEKWRCTNIKCGCFIQTKVKWDSAHCPIGKW